MGGLYMFPWEVPKEATQVKPEELVPGDLFVVARDGAEQGPHGCVFVCVKLTYFSEDASGRAGQLRFVRYVMGSHTRCYSFHVSNMRAVTWWKLQ